MHKYCCFCCPKRDYCEKSLDDLCDSCGRRYGFPLTEAPTRIRDFEIQDPLGRGFYAATYVVTRGALGAKSVLKVTPRSFFEEFEEKDFERECILHSQVAAGTEHIVGIRDMFDVDVKFGATTIPCKVAELEYVEGDLLATHFERDEAIPVRMVAQIAVDLFHIRNELQNKGVNHNDLHASNIVIENLGADARRAAAIDDTIRAVAIDLGSIANESRSDDETERFGDLRWIAEHISELISKLLSDPDDISDIENRLANALQIIVQNISPDAEYQRTPVPEDFISHIEDSFYRVTQHWRPWREALNLKAFGASYNAQTMQAWHVPHLLVDPDGAWLNAISAPGPQVITGMRGCGKTMFLRALQFHARAAQRDGESNQQVLKRLNSDNYVGLFVSAQRLLDPLGRQAVSSGDQFARLVVAYGLESVRAVQHLKDIEGATVSGSWFKYIGRAVGRSIGLGEEFSQVETDYDLERKLSELLLAMSRADTELRLVVHPNVAFPALDEAIRQCSPMWLSAQVLFLLDDVSTRYLERPRIAQLLSALLFQNPTCSFKLTSEVQTIELGLQSPGQIHPARIGRDLAIFDLGAEVYEKIRAQGKGNGRDFVERILEQRAKHFTAHPSHKPGVLLGDVPLERIAREIGHSNESSRDRKGIYRGITALARMCVGDIGDVISLYEQILRKAAGKPFPIAQHIQSECFQDFCARRLYDLNRRGGYLKDVAKSFAEASHELLMKSCRAHPNNAKKIRIRQYSSLYVRITTGKIEDQMDRLRELIDAGVFVFAGGSHVPRAKTRDANPTQQFKVTYRKIYGLVNFIGLAERDRFELSGVDLEAWLAEPENGKEILLRNLGGDCTAQHAPQVSNGHGRAQEDGISSSTSPQDTDQLVLFGDRPKVGGSLGASNDVSGPEDFKDFISRKGPRIRQVEITDQQLLSVDSLILGLGFEDRALHSIRRLCKATNAKHALAIEYVEKGRSSEIQEVLASSGVKCTILPYEDLMDKGLPSMKGRVAVDITGLSKPIVFHSIRNELRHKGQVLVWHTEAKQHYPLDADLQSLLVADNERNFHLLLEEARGVLSGEEGPYVAEALLQSDSDETRQRVLFAASSAKHERLLSLLDQRDYDRLEIVMPKRGTARSRVAQIAAEIAARNAENARVTEIDSDDFEGALDQIFDSYLAWYVQHGLNFELGLTGSKLHAVACAVGSAALKISQCWYIRPRAFDPERFTKGVGETKCFEISLRN